MKRSLLLACGVLLLASPGVRAEVKMPAVFASHMVVQRQMPLTIWGYADAGEAVTVSFGGKTASASADDKGRWQVSLPKFEANAKGQTMTVKGKNTVELTDVLVGEVWLGSGQSNMEWPLRATTKGREAVAAADHPTIRLLHVKKVQANAPAKDVQLDGAWSVCSPKTVPNFSAVLYYFGVRIQKELDVPVGLINSSWGGSPIEAWITEGKGHGGMYNGMIAPLQPVALRGLLWYQGESNMSIGMAYHEKTEKLVKGWRKAFGQQDLPFYYVQIAPFAGYGKNSLPNLWEAQTASLNIPHTGMAVITDLVDNVGDIHPQNKLDVGNRLALWALAKTYGKKDLVYSGPLYKSMKVEGDKVRVSFAHAGGLKSRDGKDLTSFEIAGEDGKFVPAKAAIDGKDVVVSSPDVAKPTQVRFGWTNTANPNLSNKEGLPASPFRTKDWKGGTGE